MSRKSIVVRVGLALFLLVILGFSAYQLIYINNQYTKEAKLHEKLMDYRPESPTDTADAEPADVNNQGILDLQALNPDVAGWVTISGTQMDYPFVWASDYDSYLYTDYEGDSSIAGSIFLDYRCDRDFTRFNTILFGHNMNNGSMFGDIDEFEDKEFYDSYQEGMIYLPHQNLTLQLVSCLVVKDTDSQVYRADYNSDGEKQAFLDRIRQDCIHGAEAVPSDLKTTDQFVSLSTCSYQFSQSRTVLIYRVIKKEGA
ncbi:MAG: class B sortase [Hespellia sp.]|nr:class B sortase [Hespellia sp.]